MTGRFENNAEFLVSWSLYLIYRLQTYGNPAAWKGQKQKAGIATGFLSSDKKIIYYDLLCSKNFQEFTPDR